MTDKYILGRDHQVIPCDDLTEWARWFETAYRHVADDHFGDVRVSTVFLGLDHRLLGEGPPLVFETMIFGGKHDQSQWRCSTWEEAEKQHAEVVRIVRGAQRAHRPQ